MRKVISFLLILSSALFVYNVSKDKCHLIQCNESTSLNKGTCLEVTSNPTTLAKTWSFNKCASGYHCPGARQYPGEIRSYSCEEVPEGSDYIEMAKFCLNQHPGEPCNFNEHCESGVCKGHVCVGAKEGLACSKHIDCNVGLFCSGSVCTKLKAVGASCSNNFECENYAGCIDNKCVEYFSQAVSSEVKYANQCNFNIARMNSNGKLICDALILERSECGEGQDQCFYRWYASNEPYVTECQCDPTRKTQNRMCPTLLEASRPFIYTEKHTERRFEPTCDNIGKLYKTNCTGIAIFGEEAWEEISSKFIFTNILALIFVFGVALF